MHIVTDEKKKNIKKCHTRKQIRQSQKKVSVSWVFHSITIQSAFLICFSTFQKSSKLAEMKAWTPQTFTILIVSFITSDVRPDRQRSGELAFRIAQSVLDTPTAFCWTTQITAARPSPFIDCVPHGKLEPALLWWGEVESFGMQIP